jgi:tRNA U34 5-methylaminomethyl-2-thiouridine-forming methyltransferase MnmC
MIEFCKSADNSNTLYSDTYKEHYHSIKDGALTESFIKHINPAFEYILQYDNKEISILDICFGLGYNVLSTLYYVDTNIKKDILINITSIELDKDLILSLKDFKYPDIFLPYKKVINSLIDTSQFINNRFNIQIILDDVRKVMPTINKKFDIVYQDAFSYSKNPALWTYEYFKDIKKIMNIHSIMTTYSISTKIRLALDDNNFFLYQNLQNNQRLGTLASILPMIEKEPINMHHKRKTSTITKPLYDRNI